jgi:dTDP-4-dehydrorhamnose reductase
MHSPVLVTGGSGQLACALEAASRNGGMRVRRVGRPEFDFDRPASIERVMDEARPGAVVNAAAYTGVDAAETDAEAAMRANCEGPRALAELCARASIPLLHVSTDYVFDGSKGAPYVETDPTNPQGVYGRTKLAGEQVVMEACPKTLVLRTSWVYAPQGKNFVQTMLRAARKTHHLRVVADQKGCPTAAADLADTIMAILANIRREGWGASHRGIYHAAGSGWTTWHGLALAVFEEAARQGLPAPCVDPIATSDWPTAAKRPMDSRLDCRKLERRFGVRLPPWRESLNATIESIFAGQVFT